MTRPIYETEENRQNEMSVAQKAAQIIGGRLIKARNMSSVDYLVEGEDGVINGLLEIKVRKYSPEEMDAKGGFFLRERKLLLIHATAKNLKADFHLVVKASNNLLHFSVLDGNTWPKLERMTGGRFDRQDEKDVEVMCLFPIRLFKKVE